eukprot:TRINITY_DN35515_c0_g1_i1.p1 TRINITY_DN35515_c0_g1~~TRINITY_DN35515_c0_g1_i1.p1  ORF type:complete len:234 (+),score=33.53 TRINITY_DN35515_c0_g1_i1:734-1435(+)
MSHAQLVAAAEDFVKTSMAGWDSSHDWWHAERVRRTALSLAEEEDLSAESKQIVELAALLHDVGDHKYAARAGGGPESIERFLEDYEEQVSSERRKMIIDIISRMGFKEELGGSLREGTIFPELAVVQDADRLDAIGAIGIARCLTFGGSRDRVLHDPSRAPRANLTKEEYAKTGSVSQSDSSTPTTIHHFYEKLLLLKDLMKTKAGRKRAEGRHKCMEEFLDRFYDEWDGKS